MDSKIGFLILCLSSKFLNEEEAPILEPKCYSRYDYDHKVLTSLVTMEIKVTQMQERVSEQSKKINGLETQIIGNSHKF